MQSCFIVGMIISVHGRSRILQILGNLQESLMQSSKNVEVLLFTYLTFSCTFPFSSLREAFVKRGWWVWWWALQQLLLKVKEVRHRQK